jgi:hypothetical protein
MRNPRAKISKAMLPVWVAALAAALCLGLLPGRASAQTKEYHMDHYDSTITVNADGSMDIVETLTFVFTRGTFRRGSRIWDLDKVEGIRVTGVAEESNSSLVPYLEGDFDPDTSTTGITSTYGIENTGSTLRLRWIFGTTTNASRTFQLAYHVDGAIRVYDNRNELDWYAVPPEWGSPINRSRVNVIFPEGINTSSWDVASVPTQASVSKQGNTITWSTSSNLEKGFEVGTHIPKNALSIPKPSWQDSFDRQQTGQLDSASGTAGSGLGSFMNIGFFVFSGIVLFGGILWQLVGWLVLGTPGW